MTAGSWRKARRVMCRGTNGTPVEVVTGIVDIEPGLSIAVLRVDGEVVVIDEALSAGIVTNIRHTVDDWLKEKKQARP